MKFHRVHLIPKTFEQKVEQARWVMKHEPGLSFDAALELVTLMHDQDQAAPCYQDETGTYQVLKHRILANEADREPMTWLSIKRVDREPIDGAHWRILQEIKNAIVGEEVEAVELYPAESRCQDGANQYHLWCLPPGQRFPFGFADGKRTSDTMPDAKQRPIGEGVA